MGNCHCRARLQPPHWTFRLAPTIFGIILELQVSQLPNRAPIVEEYVGVSDEFSITEPHVAAKEEGVTVAV